jgi:hypothetical protein
MVSGDNIVSAISIIVPFLLQKLDEPGHDNPIFLKIT